MNNNTEDRNEYESPDENQDDTEDLRRFLRGGFGGKVNDFIFYSNLAKNWWQKPKRSPKKLPLSFLFRDISVKSVDF